MFAFILICQHFTLTPRFSICNFPYDMNFQKHSKKCSNRSSENDASGSKARRTPIYNQRLTK